MTGSSLPSSRALAEQWNPFSADYASRVVSITSFARKRKQISQYVIKGLALDLGCGPLGLMLIELNSIDGVRPIGVDVSEQMVRSSSRQTGTGTPHVVGDMRELPLRDKSADSVIATNSILPETRPEVDAMVREIARVLRSSGRLVAVMPSFEMSLTARDKWRMRVTLDYERRRERDTTGWQCFYTRADLDDLMRAHRFESWTVEPLTFAAPDECSHVRTVYREDLRDVPEAVMKEHPLFEHLLVATR